MVLLWSWKPKIYSKPQPRKEWGRSVLDLIVEEICLIGGSYSDFSKSQVKRGWSTVSHLIARQHPSNGVEEIFVDDFPQGALAFADLDVG